MIVIDEKHIEKLIPKCKWILDNPNIFPELAGFDLETLIHLFVDIERDKQKRDQKTDTYIDYNDEIESVVPLNEKQKMIDISVSGDNLFFANKILTKNSFGLPATADLMIVLIRTEELDKQNQLLVKQLKNRYNDATINKRFILGINRAKMKLFDISNPEVGLVKMEDDPDLKDELRESKMDSSNFTNWKPSFGTKTKTKSNSKELDFGGTTESP